MERRSNLLEKLQMATGKMKLCKLPNKNVSFSVGKKTWPKFNLN